MVERNTETGGEDFAELDAFFAAGRGAAPVADAELLARVLADAERVRIDITTASRRQADTPSRQRWFALLGGWQGITGLATATVAGLWLGIAMPDAVRGLAAQALPEAAESTTIDLMAAPFDMAAAEE